jgi:hypothetical protein
MRGAGLVPEGIETDRPSVARLYDFFLGGQHNFAAEITQFFCGFDLVPPGLVYLPLWRPEGPPPGNPEQAWFYAGVGRKP